MNLRLVGLLGLLVTGCDAPRLQDSIMTLMDSVAPAVNSQGARITAEVPYIQNQRETYLSKKCLNQDRTGQQP
jgi:hypothetical protein